VKNVFPSIILSEPDNDSSRERASECALASAGLDSLASCIRDQTVYWAGQHRVVDLSSIKLSTESSHVTSKCLLLLHSSIINLSVQKEYIDCHYLPASAGGVRPVHQAHPGAQPNVVWLHLPTRWQPGRHSAASWRRHLSSKTAAIVFALPPLIANMFVLCDAFTSHCNNTAHPQSW